MQFTFKKTLLAACCTLTLIGCGGGGNSDNASSSNASEQNAASNPDRDSGSVDASAPKTSAVTLPGEPTSPPDNAGATPPPDAEVGPPTPGYVKIADLPLGSIEGVQSVAMNARSKLSYTFPPDPVAVIDTITNPVSGDIKLRLVSKSSVTGGYLSQIGASMPATASVDGAPTAPSFDELVVSLINSQKRILGINYDISSGNPLRFALVRGQNGSGYVAAGAWEASRTAIYVTDYWVTSGGFAFGSQTRPEDFGQIHSRTYAGALVGKLRYQTDWVGSPSYPLAGAVIQGVADMDARKISFQVPKVTKISVANDWSVAEAEMSPPLFTCDAHIDVVNNAFSCDLKSNDGYPSTGRISGRFYGPKGEEIGGVLNYTNWSTFPFGEVVAGFALTIR
ncbi:transferrin-binding protein-like solute binding protein [Paraburkholderia sp. UCT2]|uniref:transferrin-binding protein-like solute binding protein n=1 Tax=Paraburkholderia sp. UCT2 TaxID=2615208 RepID=UPI0016556405|nr:transferrin-binding protein-like solute binding protein [Paraburkholderia sp. UCT2]MBC8731569.1 transferrin-binding protein-like solute binding protein [Paraburkholderia sp. UCT2]